MLQVEEFVSLPIMAFEHRIGKSRCVQRNDGSPCLLESNGTNHQNRHDPNIDYNLHISYFNKRRVFGTATERHLERENQETGNENS